VFLSTGIRRRSLCPRNRRQVIDTTKGVMPGATVTVINTGTNAQRVVSTDGEGRFFPFPTAAAIYTVRVEL